MKTGRCRNKERYKEFHHPKLCHSVKKEVACNRERCRAVHLWTREKSTPQTQPQAKTLFPPQQAQPITVPEQQTITMPAQQTHQVIVPQQQQLSVPKPQQSTFLSTPPQISPPDPLQELRKILELLALRVDTLTQNMGYPTQIVRTMA